MAQKVKTIVVYTKPNDATFVVIPDNLRLNIQELKNQGSILFHDTQINDNQKIITTIWKDMQAYSENLSEIRKMFIEEYNVKNSITVNHSIRFIL